MYPVVYLRVSTCVCLLTALQTKLARFKARDQERSEAQKVCNQSTNQLGSTLSFTRLCHVQCIPKPFQLCTNRSRSEVLPPT